jgi:membrane protease YdiL (CAAX protease family)
LAQVVVQTLVGIVVGTRLALETRGTADPAALATAIQALGGPGACVSGAMAGLAVIRTLAPRRETATSAGLSHRFAALLWPFVAGVTLAVCYIVAAKLLYPPTAELAAGPFATMAGSPGVHRALWAGFAVCCAPAIEETVFRGALFTALRRAWGALFAGVVVTSAFVALHATELGGYPPAMIAVTSLALLALALRMRTGTVAAAIAAHTGYNLAIVINSLLA